MKQSVVKMTEEGSPGALSAELESRHPSEILAWAASTVDNLAVVTSFQSSGLVILDLMRDIYPDIPVIFLDTGYHFPETLAFRDRIVGLWDLNLLEVKGDHARRADGPTQHHDLYRTDPNACCAINKVQPLQQALAGFGGWISGLRRDQSPQRAAIRIVDVQALPSGSTLLKIHPLAAWSKNDVESYLTQRGIPTHPLLEQGFESVGCWPCTRRVDAHQGPRAGRWYGMDKTECGIHTFGQ